MVKYFFFFMEGCDNLVIVNIGFIEGLGVNVWYVFYVVFKVGVYGLIWVLVVDLGLVGIWCNVVVFGWVDIDLNWVYVDKYLDRDWVVVELVFLYLVGWIGDLIDVVVIVLWLFILDVGFVIGQVFIVDGGCMSCLFLFVLLVDDV